MNIYVGNISWGLKSDGLFDVFAEYGQVADARIITDRETGRSKGFAFVEMPNEEEALAAIEALNTAEFDGRALTVNQARPRTNDR